MHLGMLLFSLAMRTIAAAAAANGDAFHRMATTEAWLSFSAIGSEVWRIAIFFSFARKVLLWRHGVGLYAPFYGVPNGYSDAVTRARAEMIARFFWM